MKRTIVCKKCKNSYDVEGRYIWHGSAYSCSHCGNMNVHNEIIYLECVIQELLDYHNGDGRYDVSGESDEDQTLGELWDGLEEKVLEILLP